MRTKISVTVDAAGALSRRGLGSSDGLRRFIASEVERRCRSRVPYRTGRLMESAVISDDGSALTYTVDYAARQYYGVGESGMPLRYNGAPMRGSFWVERMLADERGELTEAVRGFIGGETEVVWEKSKK
ncbi:MAG: hypothetical protein HUJ65_03925 [Oscillospiraceae bacterium]|nr:hypothetical protein [Oscillospiraceae bacterium]